MFPMRYSFKASSALSDSSFYAAYAGKRLSFTFRFASNTLSRFPFRFAFGAPAFRFCYAFSSARGLWRFRFSCARLLFCENPLHSFMPPFRDLRFSPSFLSFIPLFRDLLNHPVSAFSLFPRSLPLLPSSQHYHLRPYCSSLPAISTCDRSFLSVPFPYAAFSSLSFPLSLCDTRSADFQNLASSLFRSAHFAFPDSLIFSSPPSKIALSFPAQFTLLSFLFKIAFSDDSPLLDPLFCAKHTLFASADSVPLHSPDLQAFSLPLTLAFRFLIPELFQHLLPAPRLERFSLHDSALSNPYPALLRLPFHNSYTSPNSFSALKSFLPALCDSDLFSFIRWLSYVPFTDSFLLPLSPDFRTLLPGSLPALLDKNREKTALLYAPLSLLDKQDSKSAAPLPISSFFDKLKPFSALIHDSLTPLDKLPFKSALIALPYSSLSVEREKSLLLHLANTFLARSVSLNSLPESVLSAFSKASIGARFESDAYAVIDRVKFASSERPFFLFPKSHDAIIETYNVVQKEFNIHVDIDDERRLTLWSRLWFISALPDSDRIILPCHDYPYESDPIYFDSDDLIPDNFNVVFPNSFWKAIDHHPIPDGADLGISEIPLAINIMVELVNLLILMWSRFYRAFWGWTGSQAVLGITAELLAFLSLDSSRTELLRLGSSDHYDRCYRWLRWEAEKIALLARNDMNLRGNFYVGLLLEELISYMLDHHFDVMPIFQDVCHMDCWRRLFGSDLLSDLDCTLDKVKGIRHKFLFGG